MLRTRQQLVIGALEGFGSVRSQKLLQVVLHNHGRGIADLGHSNRGLVLGHLSNKVCLKIYYIYEELSIFE